MDYKECLINFEDQVLIITELNLTHFFFLLPLIVF